MIPTQWSMDLMGQIAEGMWFSLRMRIWIHHLRTLRMALSCPLDMLGTVPRSVNFTWVCVWTGIKRMAYQNVQWILLSGSGIQSRKYTYPWLFSIFCLLLWCFCLLENYYLIKKNHDIALFWRGQRIKLKWKKF